MAMKIKVAIASVATLAVAATIGLTASQPQPAKAQTACSAGTTCIIGKELIQDPGSDTGTQWMVEDKNSAPMAWVNLYGLYSGGLGNKLPGGLVCVTYSTTYSVACLTPTGTLTLTPTGASGPTGPTETLTAADISEIHDLESAGISPSSLKTDLKWLAKTEKAHPKY